MSVEAAQRIAVTGCQGFIGRHLTHHLREAGFFVRGLSRSAPTHHDDMLIRYDAAGLTRGLQGMDVVIHLAGRRMIKEDDPLNLSPFLRPNVELIGDLVSACQATSVKRIVLASTIAVYPKDAAAPYSERATPARPINAYSLSKLMAESYLELLCRNGVCTALSFRIAATYGLGEKNTPVLMRFIEKASRGEKLVLTGNPSFEIDQLYVKDLTSAFIAALRNDQVTGVLNIGGGTGISVLEMAELVNTVFGQAGNLDIENAQVRPTPKSHMDISESSRLLNWSPQFSLRAGLTDLRHDLRLNFP